MELDLFAGRILPKTTVAEATAIEGEGEAVPEFSTLMQDQPDLNFVDTAPTPERAVLLPLTIPDALAEELPSASAPELGPILLNEIDATKPKTPDVEVASEPVPLLNPYLRPSIPQDQPVSDEPDIVVPAAMPLSFPTTIAAADKPALDLRPAPTLSKDPIVVLPKKAENEPIKPEQPLKFSTVALPINKPPQTVPTLLAQPALAVPTRVANTDNIADDSPLQPIALPERGAPKAAVQAQPPLAQLVAAVPIDSVEGEQIELPFGIKIERQNAEIAQISRPSLQAAPVANQISAQLPQLITKAEKQTIELRLDPPELGRVTIHLSTNDQQVTAQLVAERVDTVDLMRRHAELLTATLARAGFSQANLSFQQGQGQKNEGEFQQFHSVEPTSEGDEPALSLPTLTGLDGRLDIRL